MVHKIITLNIRSLITKKAEIEILLQDHQPTICVLADTRLKEKERFFIPGYECYRQDGCNPRAGGVLILVKRDVPYKMYHRQPDATPGTQAVTVQVRLSRSITVTGIYHRPNGELGPVRAIINNAAAQRHHVLVGDLNARHTLWNCSTTNTLGRIIARIPLEVLHPGIHTYRAAHNSDITSTIAILLTRDPHLVISSYALSYGASDHRPVVYELEGPRQPNIHPPAGTYSAKGTGQHIRLMSKMHSRTSDHYGHLRR